MRARNLVCVLFIVLTCVAVSTAQPALAPQGWTAARSGAGWLYRPAQLPAGGTFELIITPPESLAGQDLQTRLRAHVQADRSTRGLPATNLAVRPLSAAVLAVLSNYTDRSGKSWTLMYIGAPVRAGQAQFGYVRSDLPPASAKPYFSVAGAVFSNALKMNSGAGGPSADESAPSRSPTPAGSDRPEVTHSTAPVTGSPFVGSSLSGLYLRAQFQVMLGMGSRYDYYFYFFSPDGRVYNGCPNGGTLDRFDFNAAAARDPKNTGSYRITNGRITFSWGGGRAPETSPLRIEKDALNFLGDDWTRADTDSASRSTTWLLGSFRYQMGGSSHGVGGIAQNWYTFRPDGGFETTASSAAITSAPVPQANRSRSSGGSGTYQLKGTTLSLHFTDGRVLQHTVFPYGDKSIFIDGAMFVRPR